MTSWSVRYTPPGGTPQVMGGTGMPSETFALGVYEHMVERCRVKGGTVELLKDETVVATYTKEGDGN